MDPIQRMIRDINPLPDHQNAQARRDPLPPETLLLHSRPHPAADPADTEGPADTVPRGRRPTAARPTATRLTAAQWSGLGLAAAVVAAVVAVVGMGGLMPRPSPPAAPALTAPVMPAPSLSPAASATSPAADPSSDAAECSVSRIEALPAGPYPVPQALRDRPQDFQVLGCTNGWLAFRLTEDGKRYWVDHGIAPDISRTFLYARHDGLQYIHTVDLATHDWSIPPGASDAERQQAMESAFAAAGVPVEYLQGLIGTPPTG